MGHIRMMAAASALTLLSCSGAEEPLAEPHWRVAVEGPSSCLGKLTWDAGNAGIGVASNPEWQGDQGAMEFGPVPAAKIGKLEALVRASGCASLAGKRRSCSTDYSDIFVCEPSQNQ